MVLVWIQKKVTLKKVTFPVRIPTLSWFLGELDRVEERRRLVALPRCLPLRKVFHLLLHLPWKIIPKLTKVEYGKKRA
jgi:hypothetical protein